MALTINKKNKEAIKKVAILLLYLEMYRPTLTKRICEAIGEANSRSLLKVMSSLGKVDDAQVNDVVKEFLAYLIEKKSLVGGTNVSSKIFQDLYGQDLTQAQTSQSKLFSRVEKLDDDAILAFFGKTSLQFKALILSYLSQERASSIISKLDDETAQKLLSKIMKVQPVSERLLRKIETAMIETLKSSDKAPVDNEQVLKIAMVLEQTPGVRRKTLMDSLNEENPDLAQQVKECMLSFPDLYSMDDRDLQQLLSNVDMNLLSVTLLECEQEFTDRVMDNISSRAKNILNEELEAAKSAEKTPTEIEDSQVQLVSLARTLLSTGKIKNLKPKAVRDREAAMASGDE